MGCPEALHCEYNAISIDKRGKKETTLERVYEILTYRFSHKLFLKKENRSRGGKIKKEKEKKQTEDLRLISSAISV
jgi:hypothetical protein